MDNIIFDSELVVYHMEARDQQDLFRQAGDILVRIDCVQPAFTQALIDRELYHPTGISIEERNIAIPHASASLIKKNCVLAILLKDPLEFHNMANASEKIDVKMVFVLALADGNKHLQLIRNLMQIVQQPDKINQILMAGSAQDLYHDLIPFLT